MNNFIFQSSSIFVLLLTFFNTDRGVNHGCNLKWKLADRNEFMLATGANFHIKQASKPLR